MARLSVKESFMKGLEGCYTISDVSSFVSSYQLEESSEDIRRHTIDHQTLVSELHRQNRQNVKGALERELQELALGVLQRSVQESIKKLNDANKEKDEVKNEIARLLRICNVKPKKHRQFRPFFGPFFSERDTPQKELISNKPLSEEYEYGWKLAEGEESAGEGGDEMDQDERKGKERETQSRGKGQEIEGTSRGLTGGTSSGLTGGNGGMKDEEIDRMFARFEMEVEKNKSLVANFKGIEKLFERLLFWFRRVSFKVGSRKSEFEYRVKYLSDFTFIAFEIAQSLREHGDESEEELVCHADLHWISDILVMNKEETEWQVVNQFRTDEIVCYEYAGTQILLLSVEHKTYIHDMDYEKCKYLGMCALKQWMIVGNSAMKVIKNACFPFIVTGRRSLEDSPLMVESYLIFYDGDMFNVTQYHHWFLKDENIVKDYCITLSAMILRVYDSVREMKASSPGRIGIGIFAGARAMKSFRGSDRTKRRSSSDSSGVPPLPSATLGGNQPQQSRRAVIDLNRLLDACDLQIMSSDGSISVPERVEVDAENTSYFVGYRKGGGERCFLKVFPPSQNECGLLEDKSLRILQGVNGVPKLLHSFITSEGFFIIVTEYCGKNLKDFLIETLVEKVEEYKSEQELQQSTVGLYEAISKQVKKILGSVHRKGILHGDLKPSNLCVNVPEEGDLKVYIIDFDHAVFPSENGGSVNHVGTKGFESPETRRTGIYTNRSETYGYGKLLEFMLDNSPVDLSEHTTFREMSNEMKEALAIDPRNRFDL